MSDMPEPQVNELLESAQEAINNKNITLALQQLLSAADIAPEDVEIINQVARCYYILGEFERAVACWNLALVTDPTNQTAEQAMKDFNDLSFQFWLKRYREAVAELENRNYTKAGSLLRDLVSEQDGFISLYQMLGLCHFAESDIETARRVWARGLALDVSNQILIKYLAMRKEPTAAEQPPGKLNGSKFLWFKTAGWVVAACLGLVLLTQIGLGFYQHAGMAMLNSSARKADHNLLDKTAGRVPKAEKAKHISRVSNKEESKPSEQYITEREKQYYETGYKAYLKRDWPTACVNLNTVVVMNTGDYISREALYYLAQSNYFRKNYSKARELFEKYLAAYPNSNYVDDSLYYLGCSALEQRDISGAKKAFEQIKKINPQSGYFTTREYKSIMESK